MWDRVIWNDELDGNLEHIADNGLSAEDVEFVLARYESKTVSRSTGMPCVFGYTEDGVYIIVVYEEIGESTVYPITAYAVAEPKKRKRR